MRCDSGYGVSIELYIESDSIEIDDYNGIIKQRLINPTKIYECLVISYYVYFGVLF